MGLHLPFDGLILPVMRLITVSGYCNAPGHCLRILLYTVQRILCVENLATRIEKINKDALRRSSIYSLTQLRLRTYTARPRRCIRLRRCTPVGHEETEDGNIKKVIDDVHLAVW